MKAIKCGVALVGSSIVGHVQIPQRAVIVDTVPSVLGDGFVRSSVHYIARDILATAEGGEKIGEVVADTFMGA